MAVAAPARYYVNPTGQLADDLASIIKTEGGYAERKTEPGGSVNYGIAFATFEAWEKIHKRPHPTFATLKAMTPSTAAQIYAATYAPPIFYHLLGVGVGRVLLDSAVNNGVGGAISIAQAALHLDEDAHVGPVTLWALTHHPRVELINKLCDMRIKRQATFKNAHTSLPGHPGRTWDKVWTERVERVRKEALELAKGH